MDKERWAHWSPVLDELLEASTRTRARRVEALRAEDGAEELEALLAGLAQVDAGFLETPAPLAAVGVEGQVVGAYRLEQLIGEGGMGVVWRARRADGRFDGHVAIKFVRLSSTTPSGLERFAREGRILARLSHPNIARLLDAGVDEHRQPYLVLEYVDGQPLDRHCDTLGLDLQRRLALFEDVLAAVAHAHTRLILHRDIKPGNILVDSSGTAKLLDFGIAKLLGADDDAAAPAEATRAGAQLFTPAYAAPEQVQGRTVSTATDVYALGVLLYRLLGGGPPTGSAEDASSPLDALRAVTDVEPRRLSDAVLARAPGRGPERAAALRLARRLRGDLDNIVAKALRKVSAERYANAAEFADDLRRHLQDEPVRARGETATYLASKFVRRHRLGLAATTAVAGALAFAAVSSAWQARRLQQQQQRAEGLIEFMLGDLRKKLQPVGRLDVLDGIGAEVLAYYDRADAGDKTTADDLGRRARALHLVGEIHEKRGHPEEAAAAFQEAARTTRMLLDRAPSDGQRVFDHAQSVFWVGNIARRLGRTVDAEAAMKDYLALAHRLVALDPTRTDWRMEVAYASGALGVLQLEARRPDDALRSLRIARGVQDDLAPARPELFLELARTWGWIFEAQLARDDLDAAMSALDEKRLALERIPHAADDRIAQEQQAMVLAAVGSLERLRGRIELARAARAESLRRYEALVALDPSHMVWLANLSAVRIGMAETLADLGDAVGALALLRQADTELGRARAGTAAETPRQRYLRGRSLLVHARIVHGPALAPAIAELRGFLASAAATPVAGSGVDMDQAQLGMLLRQALAAALARAGQASDAHAEWSALLRELASLAPPQPAQMQVVQAQALRGLGHSDEAARIVARVLQQTACRSPELLELQTAMVRDRQRPSPSRPKESSHERPAHL